MSYKTINLELGMPTVEEAKKQLALQLRMAKSGGVKAVKIIHGYGSSGKGGAIKAEVHRQLRQKERAGEIKAFVRGEDFSPFESSARKALSLHPALSKDRDYSRTNHGISIVIF